MFFGKNDINSINDIELEAATGYNHSYSILQIVAECYENERAIYDIQVNMDLKEQEMVNSFATQEDIVAFQEIAMGELWDKIKTMLANFWKKIKRFVASIGERIQNFIDYIKDFVTKNSGALKKHYYGEIKVKYRKLIKEPTLNIKAAIDDVDFEQEVNKVYAVTGKQNGDTVIYNNMLSVVLGFDAGMEDDDSSIKFKYFAEEIDTKLEDIKNEVLMSVIDAAKYKIKIISAEVNAAYNKLDAKVKAFLKKFEKDQEKSAIAIKLLGIYQRAIARAVRIYNEVITFKVKQDAKVVKEMMRVYKGVAAESAHYQLVEEIANMQLDEIFA